MFFLHSLLFPSLPTMCLFFRPAAAWILFSDRSNILPFHSTARRSRERIATQCHDQRRVLKRPFWNVGLNHMWLDKYSLLRTGRITCGRQMETVKFNMRDGVGLQQTASGRWSVENGKKKVTKVDLSSRPWMTLAQKYLHGLLRGDGVGIKPLGRVWLTRQHLLVSATGSFWGKINRRIFNRQVDSVVRYLDQLCEATTW